MKWFKKAFLGFGIISMIAMAGCGGDGDFDTSSTLTGKAIDGYLSGATVFIDENDNGVLDSGEVSTTTDANGDYKFSLTDAQTNKFLSNKYPIVVTGGIDIESKQPFTGILKAPAPDDGSYDNVMVTPITTLVKVIADTTGVSVKDAAKTVVTNLGLAEDLGTNDITKIDPVALQKTSSDDALVAAAKKVHKANVKIANILKITAGAVQGATNVTDAAQQNTVFQKVFEDAAKKLAAKIQNETVDFESSTEVSNLASSVIDNVKADSTALADTIKTATGSSTAVSIDTAKIDTVQTTVVSLVKTQSEKIDEAYTSTTDVTTALETIGAVSSIIEKKTDDIQKAVEDGNTGLIDTDISDSEINKQKETNKEIDVTTDTDKGFVLKDNSFDGYSVSAEGKVADMTVSSSKHTVSFTVLNYTGAVLSSKTSTMTMTISPVSSSDKRYIKAVIPVIFSATSADNAGVVSVKVLKDAELNITGVNGSGTAVKVSITNDVEDLLESDVNGAVSIDLEAYVNRLSAKAKAKDSSFEDVDLTGDFTVTVDFGTGVTVGYLKDGSFAKFSTNDNKLYGNVTFQ